MKNNFIEIRGAKVHNLKNISLKIPKNKFVVITGLSGSGKSSLAFDTIYAESERRFVESLSSYARQFLGVKEKPDVEKITGLSPAISITERSIAKNPRSTVGTITEIHDYLRILFARMGTAFCPNCGRILKKQTIDEMLRQILKFEKGSVIYILAPVATGQKGEHRKILENIKERGYLRVRIDKNVLRTEESLEQKLDKHKKHSIEAVIDRLILDEEFERERIRDSLEQALGLAKGVIIILKDLSADRHGKNGKTEEILFSENFACPICEISFPAIERRLFSFNSPFGACQNCHGLGKKLKPDPDLIMPNKELSLAEGAIFPWAGSSRRGGRQNWYWWLLEDLAQKHGFSLNEPLKNLPQKILDIVLYGDEENEFEGVVNNLERRYFETESEWTRAELERYMKEEVCKICGGLRLRREALSVKINGKNIAEVSDLSVDKALDFISGIKKQDYPAFSPLLNEISKRLGFLLEVGLNYLSLGRESTTLSGGESQRVRLATQIGSGLSGVLYVLDEPSIGLHPRDHLRLIKTLKELRDLGNTIIVVEHDKFTMENADWIVDLGPGAGEKGGRVVFAGPYKEILKAKTLTGRYLSEKEKIEFEKQKIAPKSFLIVRGAEARNLKNIDAKFPLAFLIGVSGVSGSGKSTLVNDILAKSLAKHFYGSREEPGKHKTIEGIHSIDKIAVIDQSRIGRAPRSNPATYAGVFSHIRDLFAKTVEARSRGYTPGRFSFNVKGGRCEECEGQGVKKIEMYFLPDIYVECEECKGTRYNQEALSILYKNKNIAEILDMPVEKTFLFFKNIPPVKRILSTLIEVGLGYVKLGQSATTLSGGEAQRVKLAKELAKKETGRTLYILDEPTTGLHFEDIKKLLKVLRGLVKKGNTVIVIEHNPDVLKNCDWLIDLGPEGGERGGKIIAEGPPETIAKSKISYTGKYL